MKARELRPWLSQPRDLRTARTNDAPSVVFTAATAINVIRNRYGRSTIR